MSDQPMSSDMMRTMLGRGASFAAEEAELAGQLAKEWEDWAVRALVKPWKWDRKKNKKSKKKK